jgi:uncharacterized protein YigE (DUF2233 family)
MPLKNTLKFCLLFMLLTFSIPGCSFFPTVSINGTPVTNGNGTGNALELNKWKPIAAGMDLRYEDWKSPNDDEDIVTIVRLNPQKVQFSVGYEPDNPLTISEWMTKEKANVIINGGYFSQATGNAGIGTGITASGLVITNGQAAGTNYADHGGMFSVDRQGKADLRYMGQRPFDPNTEQLQYATQSLPMLVTPGKKRANFNANEATSRRSIVARDTSGNILFIASPNQAFTLDDVTDHLMQSDLSIDSALNLDGGTSTALYARGTTDQQVSIDQSYGKLPIVIIAKVK